MIAVFSRELRRQVIFGWVNFALAVPSIYLCLGLPLIMRQQGWSGIDIGLLQLSGILGVFKVFLALPVERWPARRAKYTAWAALTLGGFLFALLALAAVGPNIGKAVLFGLVLLAASCGIWADIPVNALAIRLFSDSERPRAGGIRSAATFASAIVGGGVMLLVQQAYGWAAPFLAMGAALLLALLLIGSVGDENNDTPVTGELTRLPSWRLWTGFVDQPHGKLWILLLLGYFPFVASAWVYLKPLLLDGGFPLEQVAWIAGIGGGSVGVLASLAFATLQRRHLSLALKGSAFANVLTLLILAFAFRAGADSAWMIAASALLAVALGVTSSLAFVLMMAFSREDCRAVDYGFQAGVFTLGRLAVLPLAGLLLDRFGATLMLLALALAALGIALIIARHKF